MQNILDWNSMMLTPWQKSPNSRIKLWNVKGFEHQLLDQSSICKQSGEEHMQLHKNSMLSCWE
jgi:hypothetical protein